MFSLSEPFSDTPFGGASVCDCEQVLTLAFLCYFSVTELRHLAPSSPSSSKMSLLNQFRISLWSQGPLIRTGSRTIYGRFLCRIRQRVTEPQCHFPDLILQPLLRLFCRLQHQPLMTEALQLVCVL